MKLLKNAFFALLSILFLFQSCTIQKRVYRAGYHVEWHKAKNSNSNVTAEQSKDIEQEFNQVEEFQSEVSADYSVTNDEFNMDRLESSDGSENQSSRSVNASADEGECDVIILTNGDEILAKVLEVGSFEVKYLKCDNLTGPSFTLRKSTVFMIKHPNGTKTLINDPSEADDDDESGISDEEYIATISSDDKSFMVAVVVWFFLGIIGIHRFYLGHYGIGILYLLTAGLCGIGWIVDGILFVTGSLQPKHGEYIDD